MPRTDFSTGCSTVEDANLVTQQASLNASASSNGSKLGPLSLLQSFARRQTLSQMGQIEGDGLHFFDRHEAISFGGQHKDRLSCELKVSDPQMYGLLATRGSLGFAESYLRGYWETDHLTTLLRVLYRHLDGDRAKGVFSRISRQVQRRLSSFTGNTRNRSQRQIAAHYDLSNEFFELFLDPTLMYSSAWFESEDTPLHEASTAKIDRICRKLNLQSGDEVLEIGTGWGGFALQALRNYDLDLTTTTISQAQLSTAGVRLQEAGLSDRVRLLDADYRDLKGTYDKLVSIEMIEAVGQQHLDTYFQCCGRLLKPGGRFAMQAIVMPESRYSGYCHGQDFIQKYIFPGGFLPSVSAIQESVGRESDLRLESVEDMSWHYAKTLEHWRLRFESHLPEIKALGFDDRFVRMWRYYLCYCEAAFREQAVRVVQMVWDKPNR